MLADWITQRLTGEFVTDPSIGSSSGMFELARRSWSPEIIDICGMRAAVFPSVLAPGSTAGVISAAAATATGLQAGTPVVVGGADTQLGLVGIGVVDPGQFTVVGGTFWQHTIGLPEAMIDPKARLRTLCHALPDQWMMEGIGFYSGLTMRWFRDAFCDLERQEAQSGGVDAYMLMERAAKDVPPGSEEAAAYVSLGHMHVIEEVTERTIDDAVFTGGASKGMLWPRVLADVLGIPVKVPRVKESTALGAAIFAGIGAGLYPDVGTAARQVVSFDVTLEPDAEVHGRYRDLYERWKLVYEAQLGLVEQGLLKPLWRAAGT